MTFEMIKFSHSIFALPFALVSILYAAGGLPQWHITALIVFCMVSARNAAMAFNRWADADIDAQNPRTRERHIPKGILSRRYALLFCLTHAVLFIAATFFVNPLAFALSLPTLAVLLGYSYTKRLTSMSHLALGLALGLAPIGAAVAVTGTIWIPSLWLCLAVLFWVAGFDIIYACQDAEFDRASGQVFSIPQLFGIPAALKISKFFHLAMVIMLQKFLILVHAGALAQVGLMVVVVFLVYEHWLLRGNRLDQANAAFFTANGAIAVVFCLFVSADVLF